MVTQSLHPLPPSPPSPFSFTDEQIPENACVVIRLLIHNSECLGRAMAGEALGLRRVFEEAIDQLDDTPEFLTPLQQSESVDDIASHLRHSDSSSSLASSSSFSGGRVRRHLSSSALNLTLLNTRMVLSYYSSLMRLLACCAPVIDNCDAAHQLSQQKRSMAERSLNILRNLVHAEEVIGILSLRFSGDEQNGLMPPHKETALLFLDRVYGRQISNEEFLQLLTDAFLPDLRMALKLASEVGGASGAGPQGRSVHVCTQ